MCVKGAERTNGCDAVKGATEQLSAGRRQRGGLKSMFHILSALPQQAFCHAFYFNVSLGQMVFSLSRMNFICQT